MSTQCMYPETSARQRIIELPEPLCAAAEQKFGNNFSNLADLLTFVLEQLLSEPVRQLDRSEQTIVEQRLRDLGYI